MGFKLSSLNPFKGLLKPQAPDVNLRREALRQAHKALPLLQVWNKPYKQIEWGKVEGTTFESIAEYHEYIHNVPFYWEEDRINSAFENVKKNWLELANIKGIESSTAIDMDVLKGIKKLFLETA